jgi:hypothetical protein
MTGWLWAVVLYGLGSVGAGIAWIKRPRPEEPAAFFKRMEQEEMVSGIADEMNALRSAVEERDARIKALETECQQWAATNLRNRAIYEGMIEHAAGIALAVDSGRGNEKLIAEEIRKLIGQKREVSHER